MNELIVLYDAGPVFENAPAYRGQDPTRVRIEIAVEEACKNTRKLRCPKYPSCEFCHMGYEDLLAALKAREQEQKQCATASR